MKRTARCVAAACALITFSMPAMAQPGSGWGGPGGWDRQSFWRGAPDDTFERIRFLQKRVERGARNGYLTPREANWASYKLDEIERAADDLRDRHRGMLTQSEVRYFQNQLDRVNQRLHWRQRVAQGY